jgi:PAS domain S-box-containing protein
MKHIFDPDNNASPNLSEQFLKLNEDRFRLMVSVVRDYAIFMMDSYGNILTWNEGAKRLKGYEENEIIGKHFSIFYSEEDKQNKKPQNELINAIKDGQVEDEGWRLKKNGERFWANVVITRMNDEKGNLIGFTKVTRDLTERKKAEEELRNAYKELEQSYENKTADLAAALKARDEFLMIASHELKTPLTSLKLRLQIGSRNLRPDINKFPSREDLEKFYAQSLDQVNTLVDMVESFLDVSRFQTDKFSLIKKKMNFSELVEKAVARFDDIRSASDLNLKIEPDVFISADPYRLDQVITHLITNALKYAPDTTVEISLKLSVDKNYAELIVKDNGPGIDLSSQEQIFRRFERLSSYTHVGGFGLGLYFVKKIVQSHDGEVKLKSAPGEGSTFTIRIPVK